MRAKRGPSRPTEGGGLLLDGAVVFLLALLVRLAVFVELGGTAFNYYHFPKLTDMYFFVEWAKHIKDVDWLVREDFHPYHILPQLQNANPLWDPGFMETIYRKGVYHQAPLYPYFMALVFAAAGVSPRAVFLLQHLLGALLAVIVLLCVNLAMEKHVRKRPARIAAGIMTALYGPLVFYEEVLLRASLFAFAAGLAIFFTLRAERRGGGGRWLVAGLAVGAAYLTRPTAMAFLMLMAAALTFRAVKKMKETPEDAGPEESEEGPERKWKKRLAPLLPPAALIAGFLLFNSPVMARNILLGAPPLMVETDPGAPFILGNFPEYKGFSFGDTPPYYKESMMKNRARLWPCALDTLRSYEGRYDRWVYKLFVKFGWALHWYELPNNTNFYSFRRHSFWLKICFVTFFIVGPLGVLGLIELWPARRRAWPLYLYLPAMLSSLVLMFVLSRLRISLAPGLLACAGPGAVRLYDTLRAGRSARSAALTALVLAGFTTFYILRPPPRPLLNSGDFLGLQSIYLSLGHKEEAERTYLEAKKYLTLPERRIEEPGLFFGLGNMAYDLGREKEAEEFFRICSHGETMAGQCAYNLGLILFFAEKSEEALDAFRRAVFLAGDPAEMKKRLASLSPRLARRLTRSPGGKEEDVGAAAGEEASQPGEGGGAPAARERMKLAADLFEKKRFREAARLFSLVPPESPFHHDAQKNLARSLFNRAKRLGKKGESRAALDLLEKAARADRYLFPVYRAKAIIEADELGDRTAAVRTLRSAMELSPDPLTRAELEKLLRKYK